MPEGGIYGGVGKKKKKYLFLSISVAAYLLLYVLAFGEGAVGIQSSRECHLSEQFTLRLQTDGRVKDGFLANEIWYGCVSLSNSRRK